MGEIGIPRLEYLYDLTYCDLLLIERGYNRRHRDFWGATRWQTYNILCAFIGGDKLSEKGINSPKDLLKFPWENHFTPVSAEDVSDLQAEIAAINAAADGNNSGGDLEG